MRILLVEDEVRLSQALVEIFQKNRYGVDAVYDGKEGLRYARSGIYDVIVLDIMLPGMDGISVLRTLREEKNSVPVMLLTAKDDIEDRVKGLDCGADDYVTKPFSTDELLARIRAISRRKGDVKNTTLSYGDLALDKGSCALQKVDGESIKLSLKAGSFSGASNRGSSSGSSPIVKADSSEMAHSSLKVSVNPQTPSWGAA